MFQKVILLDLNWTLWFITHHLKFLCILKEVLEPQEVKKNGFIYSSGQISKRKKLFWVFPWLP